MPARLPVLLLIALVVFAPPAGAFAAAQQPVELAYATGRGPLAIATGALDIEGVLPGLLVGAFANGTQLVQVPSLTAVVAESGSIRNETFQDATLVLHEGGWMWPREDAPVRLRANVPYGAALALPAPAEAAAQAQPVGLVVAGHDWSGTLVWPGGETDLVPLEAVVSVLDAAGAPFPGWDHRRVNQDGAPSGDGEQDGVVFHLEGAFEMRHLGKLLAASVGGATDLDMRISASGDDRFPEALDALVGLGEAMGDAGSADLAPLRTLGTLSALLNGAIVFVEPGQSEPPSEPRVATVGGETAQVGSFALLRSQDLTLGWRDGEMRVQGTAAVVATRGGFAVEQPASVGPVPLLVVLLWLAAVGAVVVGFVKRPPKGARSWTLRLSGAAAALVAFLVAFVVWDGAFAQTFGTSFLTLLRQDPELAQLGVVLGVQMAPWGLAALAFAVPVRIVAGVGLRYLGKGKSLKGFANAAGFLALAVLGPLYALALVNAALSVVQARLP